MSRVVEIRVHGVGGTPAHNLLGESLPNDVVPVRESGGTGFYRRKRDPAGTVEGFVWGGLTSSKRLQALWILLLPFTLSNVAGWMIPHPRGARSPGWWKAARRLVLVLGVLLTVGYAFGTSVVLVKQVLYQWGSTWSWEWLREDLQRRRHQEGARSDPRLFLQFSVPR